MPIPLIDIGFLPVRIWDVLDILIVGFMLYSIYRLLRGSIAFNIVIGVVLLYVLWGLVGVLEMPLLSEILGQFISVGFIALIIIFQPEIRSFLIYLGNTTLSGRAGFFRRLFKTTLTGKVEAHIKAISQAIEKMSISRTGALIVLPKNLPTETIQQSGQIINAEITEELIMSIFQRKSPLHDGAMIIHGGKILAVSCVLPVSTSTRLPTKVGLRHRAGLGVTEQSESAVFIVSEETGDISFAHKGVLSLDIDSDRLDDLLRNHLT